MRDDVTPTAMLDQLERLAHAFGKPFGLQVQKMADEYAGAFRRAGIPGVALEKATDEAIGSGKRFPSVSDLLERSRGYLPETDHQRQGVSSDACPYCRVAYFYAGYEFPQIPVRGLARFEQSRTVLPKLRCACPAPDDGWYTPEALAWEEKDSTMLHLQKPRDYATNRRYRDAQR